MLYTVVLVFETSSDSSSDRPLYSEEFFSIEAASDTEAKEKAIAKGKASEHNYKNREGDTITVTFKTLVDVQEPLEATPQNEGVIYVRHFRNYQAYELFEPMLKGESL
jgi:hypothetical protein